jgi:DNA adenine methylase
MSIAFGYFGSKKRLAVDICNQLPLHNAWVELFCGSAALTLAKQPAPIEIINDLDKEIVNFFQQLRENEKELCRAIALTPYAREELTTARTHLQGLTNLERARRFLVCSMMAVNGVHGDERGGFSFSDSYSRDGREARVNRWYNLPDRLSHAAERLRSVRVENKNAKDLLEEYVNRPATLVYLDPPYLGDRTNGYNHDENNPEFHRALLKTANSSQCMIFISGYANELYEGLLTKEKGWSQRQIEASTRDSTGKILDRIEVVWMNKYFTNAQKQGQICISLSKQESKGKKLNPTRTKITTEKLLRI